MNITLVDNWKKLWKSFTVQLAILGIALPDLLQVIADNTDLLSGFDTGYKSLIRLGCLIAIILLRPVKQASLTDETKQ